MKNPQPPKWMVRFLHWFCNPVYLEEIEGDVYELFDRRVDSAGIRLASLMFFRDVLKFFRWSNIKKSNSKYTQMNRTALFVNALKVGFRNMTKNPISSVINILGLAVAISLAITTYIFIDLQLNVDGYHTKKERIFQITNYIEQEGENMLWSKSPMPLGPFLAENQSSVESFSRIEYVSASIKLDNNVFEELITYVDPGFMQMFDFPVAQGNPETLNNKGEIIISNEMAIKYFEYGNPIGQDMSIKFNGGEIKKFKVGAVLAELPYNAGIKNDFYLSFESFFDLKIQEHYNWSDFNAGTFILLNEGEKITTLDDAFQTYQKAQNISDTEWKVQRFEPIKLTELSKRAYEIYNALSNGAHPSGRIALSLLSAFLLGIACFNFMNISVAASTKRIKEIALRKVMGGHRSQLISQFLIENVLQCLFSLLAGIIMAYFIFVPGFDSLIPELDIQFRTFSPLSIFLFLTILLIATGLISGAYPAIYISRFSPVAIFKGTQKFGSQNLFSKTMLGIQFFLASLTIVACFVMTDQSFSLLKKDWGYNPTGVLSVYVNNNQQYEQLKDKIDADPAVISHTSSSSLIGRSVPLTVLDFGNKKIPVRVFSVSGNYQETMQLELIEGRSLTNHISDQKSGVMVNETFIKQMNWADNPINKTFIMDSSRYTVAAIIKDFHYYSFSSDIEPLIIKGLNKMAPQYLTLKVKPNDLISVENSLRAEWQKIAPNDSFDRVFQSDSFEDFYRESNANIKISLVVSVAAILLSCLGLYGLFAYNVNRKIKEFSIRKILGADAKSIIKIASKQYIIIVLIAFFLGAPLGYLGMKNIIESIFPEPSPITFYPLFISILILMITLTLTISGQILKAIRVNPASNLRAE